MTDERYKQLNDTNFVCGGDAEITPEEFVLGWHWCYEFDGLLVGPACSELEFCHCLPPEHPVYKTKLVEEPWTLENNPFE